MIDQSTLDQTVDTLNKFQHYGRDNWTIDSRLGVVDSVEGKNGDGRYIYFDFFQAMGLADYYLRGAHNGTLSQRHSLP